jgi:hypothetical protein
MIVVSTIHTITIYYPIDKGSCYFHKFSTSDQVSIVDVMHFSNCFVAGLHVHIVWILEIHSLA